METDSPSILDGDKTSGHVYDLYNPCCPFVDKVGFSKDDVKSRCADLYHGHTGVPMPFEIRDTVRVNDVITVEKLLHKILGEYRVNLGREFFGSEVSYDDALNPVKFAECIEKTLILRSKVKDLFDLIRAVTGEKKTERPVTKEPRVTHTLGVCRRCDKKCGKHISLCQKGSGCRKAEVNYCECGRLAACGGRNSKCKDCK
jgi:hypothetical protein